MGKRSGDASHVCILLVLTCTGLESAAGRLGRRQCSLQIGDHILDILATD